MFYIAQCMQRGNFYHVLLLKDHRLFGGLKKIKRNKSMVTYSVNLLSRVPLQAYEINLRWTFMLQTLMNSYHLCSHSFLYINFSLMSVFE